MLRSLLFACTLAGLPFMGFSQNGCTNSEAINYDPSAAIDDGSCEVFTTSISYNSALSTDFVIGTAISNQHFAVATLGSIEFGVKANVRFISDIIPINDIDYLAEAGYSPTSNSDPTPDIGKGTWDFLYSFNLGDYDFNDLRAVVSIDFDPDDSANQAAPFELDLSSALSQTGIADTSFYQGSENLGFSFWQLLAGPTANLYDPLQDGVYDIGLRLFNLADHLLGEVFIRVVVGDLQSGCTDPEACNFDPLANTDDGSCVYAEPFKDCNGDCINDFNNNGVCDEEEVFGCAYPLALNFNPDATSDDGSCVFDCELTDCERADFNNSGFIELSDLLYFLSLFGLVCD